MCLIIWYSFPKNTTVLPMQEGMRRNYGNL